MNMAYLLSAACRWRFPAFIRMALCGEGRAGGAAVEQVGDGSGEKA
jgi:hypothetical protein